MKKSSLYAVWGILYIICCGLGFIPDAQGGVRVLLLVISLLFFVPPAILLYDAIREDDRKTLRQIRLLSVISLGLTLLLMIGNILIALGGSEAIGTLLHLLLVIVSVPMISSHYWALSLFLWAVLFFAAGHKTR